MSSRPSGLSSYSISSFRSYEAVIKYENHFTIYQKVKEWFEKRDSKYKFIINIRITKEDFFCIYSNEFKCYLKIYGQIFDENVNDNDVFEELYSFFEFLFIELNMKELHFHISNMFHEENIVKIYKKDKK